MQTENTIKKVKRGARVNYHGFLDAYENLPSRHQLQVRRELQKRLHWCPSTFYFKRNGESPLRENEIPIIEEVFQRYRINPRNGERL